MPEFKMPIRRFICPVIAAYLLNLGVWSLVLQAEQVVLSEITKFLTWAADHSPAGFPRVEGTTWSARMMALQMIFYGLLPIALGLLLGWWVLNKKRRRQLPA